MEYIFLDTNIFIHFVDFEQIDWKNLLNTEEEIVIVLAPVVIDELDKHKYNKNQKIARRVKNLLPKIERYFEKPSESIFKVKFISSRPISLTFEKNNLDKSEQDDSLLATIMEFSEKIQSMDKIIYVTNDVGPRLKSKSLNIETFKLSADYLLATELDETEAKNVVLQKELNELKNRIAILDLSFYDNKKFATFQKNTINISKQSFIEAEMKQIKADNRYWIYKEPSENLNKSNFRLMPASQSQFSERQVLDYNNKLDEFFERHEKYSESLYEAFDFKNNSITLNLILTNIGTSPALDIDIEMHFPDGFELYSENDLPELKKKEKPPTRPKHLHDFSFPQIDISALKSFQNITLPDVNPNIPTIKKTNSYDVTYHFKSLKHNQALELEPLYVKFEDISTAKGFIVDYKLIVSNIPKVILGKLNVNFEV